MPKPYNFIFFQSDNHNRDLLGCYGDPLVKTPNLDRIAQNGVRFTNAYAASALCCPARASIATGRFPHQTRFWDNAIVYDGSVPSWMHRIRESGCEVVSIGKLHYRSSEDDNGFSKEILPMHIVNQKRRDNSTTAFHWRRTVSPWAMGTLSRAVRNRHELLPGFRHKNYG